MKLVVSSPESMSCREPGPGPQRDPTWSPYEWLRGVEMAAEDPEVLLEQRVRGALAQSASRKRTAALVLIDLDRADADECLDTEALIRKRVRRYDVVLGLRESRIAVCLGHLRNASELASVAQRIDGLLVDERFRRTWSTARIGTAIHTANGNARQLIEAARAALPPVRA